MAVCKGLVIEEIHRLRYCESILSVRRCCDSYGILFNERYDGQKHNNLRIPRGISSIDDKKYAVHQIHWLIRRGKAIKRDEPVRQKFYRRIEVTENPITSWTDTIAMSKSPTVRLPSNFYEGDAEPVGEVVSSLNAQLLADGQAGVERRSRRNRLGRKLGEYWQIELEVRVRTRLAILSVEIWFAGQCIGHNREKIPVTWKFTRDNPETEEDLTDGEEVVEVDPEWEQGLVTFRDE